MAKKRAHNALETANKTLEQCLEGENFDDLIKALSPKERAILDDMAKEIRTSGTSKQLNNLWKYDYKRKPPTIEEFVEDIYWVGDVTQPNDENPGLWPTWKKILADDWDLDSRIHNVVITGSLGIGKTTISTLIILYRLTLCTLLRNPQSFVGLATGSPIVYSLLSVTRSQVGDTSLAAALNMMCRSPYFLEELHFDPDSKYSGQNIAFPGRINLNAGSKGQHVLGRNTLGVLLDEGNFRLEANPDMKAYKLYNEVRQRVKNRFQKTAGFLPAVTIIASSAKDESSFTETIIEEITKKDDPKTEKVYSDSVYRMKNGETWKKLGAKPSYIMHHANKYKPRWFKVAYGLKSVAPSVLKGWYNADGGPIGEEHHELAPTGSKTELVPEDYKDDYERDTVGCLQALSGISTGGSYRLFSSMIDVEWSVQTADKAGVINPCTVDQVPISEEDDKEIWDFLNHEIFLTRQHGIIKPKRHPETKRYAHIDLATRTRAGIGICHAVGYSEIEGLIDRKSAKVFSEHRIMVEYDFILTIVAGKSKPISFAKICQFFIWLKKKCGFNIAKITADKFQSFMPLQLLENTGFEVGQLSLDTSKAPYYAFRAGFEERRIITFRQNWLMAEIEKLIDGPKMVDHPTEGDVTCLHGDTEIYLDDGRRIAISQLRTLPHPLHVYASDVNGNIHATTGLNPRVSGYTCDLVKVHIEGEVPVICTPEHQFMLRTGSFVEARRLIRGVELMPFWPAYSYNSQKLVRKIEEIKCDSCPVYDITVPTYSNFAIGSNIFVHNSKDTADGCGGAYYNCISDPDSMIGASAEMVTGFDVEKHGPGPDPVEIQLPPYRRARRTFVSK